MSREWRVIILLGLVDVVLLGALYGFAIDNRESNINACERGNIIRGQEFDEDTREEAGFAALEGQERDPEIRPIFAAFARNAREDARQSVKAAEASFDAPLPDPGRPEGNCRAEFGSGLLP